LGGASLGGLSRAMEQKLASNILLPNLALGWSIHSMLLWVTQLHEWVPGYIKWWKYVYMDIDLATRLQWYQSVLRVSWLEMCVCLRACLCMHVCVILTKLNFWCYQGSTFI
jgi:hypothetical protein